MHRRWWVPVVWMAVVFFLFGLAQMAAAQPDVRALVQIPVQQGADLGLVEKSGVPVYAQVTGEHERYLLAGATPDQIGDLRSLGLDVTILDPDVGGASYYLAYVRPGQDHPDWSAYGQILLDDGVQVLLRARPRNAERLAEAGVQLRAITLTAKPLRPRSTAEALPSAIEPDPVIQTMLDQVTSTTVSLHDRELAGELPVWVDGGWYTISTRQTYSGTPIQKAGRYVGQRMEDLGLGVEYYVWNNATNPNVIGELAGVVHPDDIFIIGAHLDDVTGTPGADDNASGSVATMLAADILSRYQWGCTLRFAFWTGEEQGLLGSAAYAQHAASLGENIVGYLNLDMIAYNTIGSNPGIDLLYNPTMPSTQALAQLFADVVSAYELNLTPELRTSLGGGSDHQSFWDQGYTSILAIEDQGDFNPYYHGSGDTPAHTDLGYFTEFVKASLGTFAHMSGCLIPSGVGYVDGHVTAASGGAPIAGADVTLNDQAGHTVHTSTNASGYYTQTLVAGTYTVTAEAYGYLPAVVSGVPVVTDTVTTVDLALDTAPTYVVSGTVSDAVTGLPLLAEVEVDGTPVAAWTDPDTGLYEVTVAEGDYTMRVSAAGHRPEQRSIVVDRNQIQDFGLEPLPCILLVDDDNNAPDVRPYYTAALDTLGYDYDVFEAGGGNGPGPTQLEGYSIVIWFSGDKYGGSAGPSGNDETNLAAYLEGGGRLFLSSQDYLYDMGLTTFGQNYLGIGSYIDDAGDATAKYGVTGDPIGDGLGPYPLTYPNGFTDYGDIVHAGPGALVAFRSSATGGNSLDVDKDGGTWKAVFFGTSWVPIYHNNAANGRQVLQRIVDWFGGCTCDAVHELELGWTPPTPIVGETVHFTGTAEGETPIFFAWDFGDETQGGGATVDHVYQADGLYTVTLTATNACGLQALSHSLTVLPVSCEAVQILSVTSEVSGCLVTLGAELGGTPPFTYSWDLGAFGSSSAPTVTVDFGSSGTYPYTLTVANCGGGSDSVTGTVEVACQAPRRYLYLPLIVRGE